MDSQVRQNYHRDCEAAINRMINMELFASYTYTSMVRNKLFAQSGVLSSFITCLSSLSHITLTLKMLRHADC